MKDQHQFVGISFHITEEIHWVMQAKKSDLKIKACQLMGLRVEDVRMWDSYMKDLYANLDEQLDDGVAGPANALNDKQIVLLEEKAGLWQLSGLMSLQLFDSTQQQRQEVSFIVWVCSAAFHVNSEACCVLLLQ